MMKKAFILVFVLIISLSFAGCSAPVRCEWGEFGILISGDYEKIDAEGIFDVAYSDSDAVIGITRMSLDAALDDGIPSTLSPIKFAEEYARRTGIDEYPIEQTGDVPYISYYTTEGGVQFFHRVAFYKSTYAYFCVVFVVRGDKEEDYSSDFLEYMESAYLNYEAIK